MGMRLFRLCVVAIFVALLFVSPARADWVGTYWVSALAAGGGVGSAGDEFTFAEVMALAGTAGYKINIRSDGTYTAPVAGWLFSGTPTNTSPTMFIGLDSNGDPATSYDDMPVLDGVNMTSGNGVINLLDKDYIIVYGLEVKNGFLAGVFGDNSTDVISCNIHDNGGKAIDLDVEPNIESNWLHDNGDTGAFSTNSGRIAYNLLTGNGSAGAIAGAKGELIGNFIRDNGAAIGGGGASIGLNGYAAFNTFVETRGGSGTIGLTVANTSIVRGNIFTGWIGAGSIALYAGTSIEIAADISNNYFGNTTNVSPNVNAGVTHSTVTTDPALTGPGTDDYSTANTDLIGVEDLNGQAANIGGWQGSAAAISAGHIIGNGM